MPLLDALCCSHLIWELEEEPFITTIPMEIPSFASKRREIHLLLAVIST